MYHKQIDKTMNGWHPLFLREEILWGDDKLHRHHPQLLLLQKKDYSPIGVVKILHEKELFSNSNQLEVQNQEELQVKWNKLKENQEMLER